MYLFKYKSTLTSTILLNKETPVRSLWAAACRELPDRDLIVRCCTALAADLGLAPDPGNVALNGQALRRYDAYRTSLQSRDWSMGVRMCAAAGLMTR